MIMNHTKAVPSNKFEAFLRRMSYFIFPQKEALKNKSIKNADFNYNKNINCTHGVAKILSKLIC